MSILMTKKERQRAQTINFSIPYSNKVSEETKKSLETIKELDIQGDLDKLQTRTVYTVL